MLLDIDVGIYCTHSSYLLFFPRGDRRRGRRREEEEQVGHDVGALEHVSADALDRADYGRRRECIRRVCYDVTFAARRVRRPVPARKSNVTAPHHRRDCASVSG